MSAVAVIPTQAAVDAAWDRYQALVRAALDDPYLYADRAHVEAMLIAHKEFGDAFLAWGGRR